MAYYPFATQFTAKYILTAPDGVVATFNDPNDANYVGALTEVTGLDSADVRESADELVEADGGTHGNFYFGRRPIILTGRVFGHSTIQQRDLRLDKARRASLALRGDSTLTWLPAVRNDNYIANPKFYTNVTGWNLITPSGGTMGTTGRTAMPDNGAEFGYRVRFTNAADTTERNPGIRSDYISVTPSTRYSIGGEAYAGDDASGANGIKLTVYYYKDNAGTPTSGTTSLGSQINDTISTRTRLTVDAFTTPSDCNYIRIEAVSRPNVSSDIVDHYWTKFILTNAATGAYFDGDTSGYYWQGDQGASPSGDYVQMFTTVRRQAPFRESGQWVKDFQIPLVSEYAVLFSAYTKTSATAGSGVNISVENRGNYIAYPILVFTGPLSAGFSVARKNAAGATVENFVTTGLGLASGETVEFDMLNHSGVFTNNVGSRQGQSANRYIDFASSTFCSIPQGTYNAVLTGTGAGTVALRYRDTWA